MFMWCRSLMQRSAAALQTSLFLWFVVLSLSVKVNQHFPDLTSQQVFLFCLWPREGQAVESKRAVSTPAAAPAARFERGEQVGSAGDVDRRKAREGRPVRWRIFGRPVAQSSDHTVPPQIFLYVRGVQTFFKLHGITQQGLWLVNHLIFFFWSR